MIFGMLNSEKIWHNNLTDLSTSPVRYSHFTLENPNKCIFNIIRQQMLFVAYPISLRVMSEINFALS